MALTDLTGSARLGAGLRLQRQQAQQNQQQIKQKKIDQRFTNNLNLFNSLVDSGAFDAARNVYKDIAQDSDGALTDKFLEDTQLKTANKLLQGFTKGSDTQQTRQGLQQSLTAFDRSVTGGEIEFGAEREARGESQQRLATIESISGILNTRGIDAEDEVIGGMLVGGTSPEDIVEILSQPEEGVKAITKEFLYDDPSSPSGKSVGLFDEQGNLINKFRNATEKDIKGKAQVEIAFGKPASPGERTAIAETRASIDAMDNLKALFDESFVGPVEGRKAQAFNIFGLNPDKQAAFMAATSAIKNQMIKDITGAQMSEVEAKRIMQQIPDITDADNVWLQKWEQTKKNFERVNKERIKVLKQSGIRAPETSGEALSNMSDEEFQQLLNQEVGQ